MKQSIKEKIFIIIFESDTPAGKQFDLALIVLILLSLLTVVLETVASIRDLFGPTIQILEWIFTGLFTIELLFRIYSFPKNWKYLFSFFGIVDLLSVLPTYFSLFIPGTQYMLMIRILRTLRIFRILKLMNYLGEANHLALALKASRPKITVFLFWLSSLVVLLGSLMYMVEGEENGFSSIPKGVYWAIVTLTTVGYGDISPQTSLGQFLASIVMILGYAIIAVPTGIVSSELTKLPNKNWNEPGSVCPSCNTEGQYPKANFCRECGGKLID